MNEKSLQKLNGEAKKCALPEPPNQTGQTVEAGGGEVDEQNGGDLALHARMLAGDAAAREEITLKHWQPLERMFLRRYYRCDPDIVHDAVDDTLKGYFNHPGQYSPDKQTLRGFLEGKVKEHIKNRCRSEERRRRREEQAAEVFDVKGLPSPSASPEQRFLEEEQRRGLLALLDNDADRAFLELCLGDEEDVATLAKPIGYQDAPPEVQKRAVKQARDRILKKLQRAMKTNGV